MKRYYILSQRGYYEVCDRGPGGGDKRHVITVSDRDMRPSEAELSDARNVFDARHKRAGLEARAYAAALNAQELE